MSIDNQSRHRGSDARDSPLLLEVDVGTGDGDVVIGGEQGDQAEDEAADGLGEAQPVEAERAEGRGTSGRAWGLEVAPILADLVDPKRSE